MGGMTRYCVSPFVSESRSSSRPGGLFAVEHVYFFAAEFGKAPSVECTIDAAESKKRVELIIYDSVIIILYVVVVFICCCYCCLTNGECTKVVNRRRNDVMITTANVFIIWITTIEVAARR